MKDTDMAQEGPQGAPVELVGIRAPDWAGGAGAEAPWLGAGAALLGELAGGACAAGAAAEEAGGVAEGGGGGGGV